MLSQAAKEPVEDEVLIGNNGWTIADAGCSKDVEEFLMRTIELEDLCHVFEVATVVGSKEFGNY
jgi:hypothetical protein